MRYNWQQKDWPQFSYNEADFEDELFLFAEKMGRLGGVLKALPENSRMENMIDAMVSEAIKSSAIEGEFFEREDVKSSICNMLGLNRPLNKIKSKKAKAAGELMVEVRSSFADPLSDEMLFNWHRLLMSDAADIKVGAWRDHDDPMQVVSGPAGKQRVHFEAPPSHKVGTEMKEFIRWFNDTAPGGKKEIKKAPLRAAIAHLYFESIHPFEDGNGRIGRALSEKALSQGIGRPALLSLSETIEGRKKEYYAALERAQQSNEIDAWLQYFLKTILAAQDNAESKIDFILQRSRFYERYKPVLNERQLNAVNRMFEEGPNGFKGGMSAKKYCAITKASKATATRDLQELLELGALKVLGAGRSTSYELVLEDES